MDEPPLVAPVRWDPRKAAANLRKHNAPTKMTESAKYKDTMRLEYDMRGGVRGKYAKRFSPDIVMVPLDPDVSAVFPNAHSVNEALRVLLKAAKKAAPAA
jgi:hypothetical protein